MELVRTNPLARRATAIVAATMLAGALLAGAVTAATAIKADQAAAKDGKARTSALAPSYNGNKLRR